MIETTTKTVLIICTAFLMTGCFNTFNNIKYVKIENKEIEKKYQTLTQRFIRYWDLFSKKEFDKAYYYELPHQRFIHTLKWYKNFNQPNEKGYTISLVKITPVNRYQVKIKSRYTSSDKKDSFTFDDEWFKIDNMWFHVMKTSRLPVTKDRYE